MTRSLTPNILIGHCDLISRFSDFALYLDTQLVYFHSFCWSHLILCHHDTDTLDMCMKKYYFEKIIFNKFVAL